jgi:type III secretion system FlhB-like substrate exporter
VTDTATEPAETPTTETHDHGEVAWRLRHAKRGVLREATPGPLVAEDEDSFIEDSVQAIGRAMGNSARFASAMLSEFGHVTAEFNLLTSTSFDRPEDLFSADGMSPRGVAFFALHAPTTAGDWSMRGAMTESDIASWIVAGSYVRRAPASHQYEAGLSYGMQRYQGGNAVALAAVSDGSRNAGAVYAYDHWTIVPGITVNYGARYARYDYLEDGNFFSPGASVTLSPAPPLRVRASVSRRHLAPGAEEFMPRAAMGVWLPPERTFSPISTRRGFTSARTNHLEVAAEHDVPVLENKPLARALYASCEIGAEIPIELFQTVAEVLAYIYALRSQGAGQRAN